MAQQVNVNRVDADLNVWHARQQGYMQTYGSEVLQDKDFLKAKLQVLKQIHNKHKGTALDFDEQISQRILSGQIRQLNRRVYRNPIVRLVRNAVQLAGNVLKAALLLLALPIKLLATTKPTPANYVLTNLQKENQAIAQTSNDKNANVKNDTNKQQTANKSKTDKTLIEKKSLKNDRVIQQSKLGKSIHH